MARATNTKSAIGQFLDLQQFNRSYGFKKYNLEP